MVDLSKKENSQGAQYLDLAMEINFGGSQNENQQLVDPVLAANTESSFKALKTIPAFSIHLLISTIISLVGILMAVVLPEEQRCHGYYIMLYLRASFWVITFIFDHFVKKKHADLRLNGYHEFHRSTQVQKGAALKIVSLWNSMLLAVQALMHHFYGNDFTQHCMQALYSPLTYINAFQLTENAVLGLTHGFYIKKVSSFNKAAPPPDALRGVSDSSGTLGLLQPGGDTTDLLEKQADLIAYLKEHNHKLNEKLHQMQLNARTVSLT